MMINYTGTYTDKYQLTMAQAYFLKNRNYQDAIFDYFFRKLPFDSGYAVFAGLEDLLNILENLHFDQNDIEYLQSEGFHPEFLKYLKNFQFKGTVYASQEGDVVFPARPILTVEANFIEAQIIETLLLNLLNFQTLIATKASRVRYVAGEGKLIDFGLRRAQGPGGYYASRAAIIGGFDGTSNVIAGRDFDIPTSGTMAHSFVQSYDDELSAFQDFADIWPDNCILLVDTYNTLESGLPNAIKTAKKMEAKGHRLKGIRLDSGDLAYLAVQSRQMLNDAGLDYVKITASNQLDEHVVKSLIEQGAPIDVFGVGTRLVIGRPEAALDGVYKLAFANNKPRIKLSETTSKITLPAKKQVYRVLKTDDAFFGADVVALADEKELDIMHHPFEPGKQLSVKDFKKEPLLHKVMVDGKRLYPSKTLKAIAQHCQQQLHRLPEEYKRFNNPHLYKIGLSTKLNKLREQLIEEHQRGSQ